ncbi:MAG: peptide ABC transporter substrate-binding protein [Eubacterium sp.]|nr:peptide ABC transporter substrate-binding protein [Eubacterium sp.]
MKKRALLLLTTIFAISLLSACTEDDGKGYIFTYDITYNPGTLDPQCAADDNSYLLINCIFEGLLKCDAAGNITGAGAKSWEVSDDGLTYTFKLRSDRYWTDVNGFSEKCTADDYVFGFTRLFLPETRAQAAEKFFCIENAEALNKGQVTAEDLGVTAEDEYTLTIKLQYEEPLLPMLLTTAAAMPCNEKYFLKAQGKYGLSDEATPSNGAFYLTDWYYDPWSNNDNHLVLRANQKYSEQTEVTALGLNFFIVPEDSVTDDFYAGTTDSLPASGTLAQTLSRDGFAYDEYKTSVYGLMMNTKSSALKNDFLRYALLYAADTSEAVLPFGFSHARAAVAQSVGLDGLNYREHAGDELTVRPDKVRAETAYQTALEQVDRTLFSQIKIIAVEGRDEDIVPAVQTIMQQWQGKLGFYCDIAFLSQSEYDAAIASGDYSIAITKLSGEYNRPDSALGKFVAGGEYRYSEMSAEYTDLIQSSRTSDTAAESFDACMQAEQLLLKDGRFIPIAYCSEYFFYAEGCENIQYDPFTGNIDYSGALYFD